MKKNSLNAIIIILTVACVVMAISLVGVIGVAVITSGDAPEKDISQSDATAVDGENDGKNDKPTVESTERTTKETTTKETTTKETTTKETTTEATTTEASTTEETTTEVEKIPFVPPTKSEPSDNSGLIIVNPQQENWNLVVVNSGRAMPEGYVPKLATVAGTSVKLDYRVAPHYDEMYYAAKKDGITLTPYSGYRSYERQKINYNNLTEKYMNQYNLSRVAAAKKAASVILPPGTSEHNLGLAMDICNTYDSFATQKEYRWLVENAHKYGFILRYPTDKSHITGINYEPWHYRYVGKEIAREIYEQGLCLEEYLEGIS